MYQIGVVHAHADPADVTQAEAHYQQALALAEEVSMRPLQAHCHHGLRTLYAGAGQREQARSELTTAIEMYQSMEMTFWLPQTEAALAQERREQWGESYRASRQHPLRFQHVTTCQVQRRAAMWRSSSPTASA